MDLFGLLARLLGKLGRMIGLVSNNGDTCLATAAKASGPIAEPAVAVLGWRYRQDRFLLARRLASIARLNVRLGRKARGTRSRFQGLPPVPKDRLGARRTRLEANRGPRVLIQPTRKPAGAAIIPFPVRTTRSGASSMQRRLAA